MTEQERPRTEAGRRLYRDTREGMTILQDAMRSRILAIEAEGRQQAVREPHGTHTPCCGWPAEHKWADPIRCMKCHEDWPCTAAVAGLNASESPPHGHDHREPLNALFCERTVGDASESGQPPEASDG